MRSACLPISASKPGMILGIASMNVTSEPSAVYTSENSSPMYPDPMIATHGGSQSSLSASSDVKTVFPSISIPGGTNGVEPVAMMMFFAVHFLFPYRDGVVIPQRRRAEQDLHAERLSSSWSGCRECSSPGPVA